MRRITRCWLLLGVAAGCLDIGRTPGNPLAGMDAGAAGASDAAAVPDADYTDAPILPCTEACVEQYGAGDPAAGPKFVAINGCAMVTPTRECTAACVPLGQPLVEPSSCTMPGILNPDPACNACVKDVCCPVIAACLGDPTCVQIGLCANRCPHE